MRGADLVLIAELIEVAVVKLAAFGFGRGRDCLADIGVQRLYLQVEAKVASNQFVLLRRQAGTGIELVAATVLLLEFVISLADIFRFRRGNYTLRLLR